MTEVGQNKPSSLCDYPNMLQNLSSSNTTEKNKQSNHESVEEIVDRQSEKYTFLIRKYDSLNHNIPVKKKNDTHHRLHLTKVDMQTDSEIMENNHEYIVSDSEEEDEDDTSCLFTENEEDHKPQEEYNSDDSSDIEFTCP